MIIGRIIREGNNIKLLLFRIDIKKNWQPSYNQNYSNINDEDLKFEKVRPNLDTDSEIMRRKVGVRWDTKGRSQNE